MDWLLFVAVFLLTGIAYWLYDKRTRRLLSRFQEEAGRVFRAIEHRLKIQAEGPMASIDGQPEIWAVITTYNRSRLLDRTARSLNRHEPRVKILVINNGSADDTLRILETLYSEGIVHAVLTNRHEDIPQWQKGYTIHQAWQLLALRNWSHWILLDDDIEVARPFLSNAQQALGELRTQGVRLISLLTDARQEHVHQTLSTATVAGESYKLKRTFNGAFLVLPREFFTDYGLPPVAEGINDLSTEDWYYSRLMTRRDERVACANAAVHLGVDRSQREASTRV